MSKQTTDDLLLAILSAYNLYPEDTSTYKIHQKVFNILKSKCYGRRVAMWGAGDIGNEKGTYVAKFMDKYAYMFQQAVCVVDARKDYEGRSLMGLPIILPKNLPTYSADIILITSFSSRKEIKKDIQQAFPDVECLDIYEELALQGIELHKDIFHDTVVYVDIYKKRLEYEKCLDPEQKGLHLKSLIQKYINIRDIPYVLKFVREYIANKYTDYQRMQQLEKELEAFLQALKDKVRKNTEDVLLIFLDAFRGCDWYDGEKGKFNVMEEISRKSACFVNMNATGPVTYESMYSIITGKMPMDGDVYERTEFRLDEFPFLDELHREDYDIKMYFSDAYSPIDVSEAVEYHRSVYLSEELWCVLCEMADGSKPCVHFLDATTELHVPFLCGYHTVMPQKMTFSEMGVSHNVSLELLKEQFQNSLDYVDLEMNFFHQFINEKVFKVIFSDHSHVVYDEEKELPFYMYYNDISRSVHNVLMISGDGIAPQIIDSLASMKEFNAILLEAYRDHRILVPKDKIVQYQYYPIVNKNIRDKAREYDNAVHFIDGIKCFRSDEYLAVYTADGYEELYRFDGKNAVPCTMEEAASFVTEVKEQFDISFA